MKRKVFQFFFEPASPLPLDLVRIAIGLILIGEILWISPCLTELYGTSGILQSDLSDYFFGSFQVPFTPSWSALSRLGVSETHVLQVLFSIYSVAAVGVLFGFLTRLSIAVAWALQTLFLSMGYLSNYGVDRITHVILFYFLWMPVGRTLAVDALRKTRNQAPTALCRFSLRVLQINLCVIYLNSGIAKMLGSQWWSGEAIWRVLNLPEFSHWNFTWIASLPWLCKLLAWGTLALETGYPLLVWSQKTSRPWIFAVVCLHLGIALSMGLYLFSALMIALSLILFGSALFTRETGLANTTCAEKGSGVLVDTRAAAATFASRLGLRRRRSPGDFL
jgi:hypothetical protein